MELITAMGKIRKYFERSTNGKTGSRSREMNRCHQRGWYQDGHDDLELFLFLSPTRQSGLPHHTVDYKPVAVQSRRRDRRFAITAAGFFLVSGDATSYHVLYKLSPGVVMPTSDLAGSSSFTIAEILAKLGTDPKTGLNPAQVPGTSEQVRDKRAGGRKERFWFPCLLLGPYRMDIEPLL